MGTPPNWPPQGGTPYPGGQPVPAGPVRQPLPPKQAKTVGIFALVMAGVVIVAGLAAPDAILVAVFGLLQVGAAVLTLRGWRVGALLVAIGSGIVALFALVTAVGAVKPSADLAELALTLFGSAAVLLPEVFLLVLSILAWRAKPAAAPVPGYGVPPANPGYRMPPPGPGHGAPYPYNPPQHGGYRNPHHGP